MSLSAGRVGVRADQVDAHGRVISPSFLNEIMEDLPEWTDLPVRVNGTEQLIPSNPSVPVTSPILADIDYPDVRRNNQYFTYRESPTTVDGLAKIKSIKGNTLVWNQLVDLSSGVNLIKGSTRTVTKGFTSGVSIVASHKYFLKWKLTNVVNSTSLSDFCAVGIYTKESGANKTIYQGFKSANGSYSQIFTSSYSGTSNGTTAQTNGNIWFYFIINNSGADSDTATFSDVQLFDLTQMFGIGNEPTSVEFTKLFPLPYYAYNSGSLLSFNGTGLKTTGFNQWDEKTEVGGINGTTGQNSTATNTLRSINYQRVLPSTNYYINTNGYSIWVYQYDGGQNFISRSVHNNGVFSTTDKTCYIRLMFGSAYDITYNNDVCINFSSSRNGEYEPYTENTTNLPVATYFPTGMKSAGSVYDEMLPTKAITRVGAVDLGSVEWMYNGSRFNATIVNLSQEDKRLKGLCAKYPTFNGSVADAPDKSLIFSNTTNAIYIKDSSYSDTATFKSAMSGVYLYYELATPVELPTLSFE